MKIGIGFFYLRKENGGGFLINVIVSSVDNSNLPVVCRYCRLIIFFYQCRDLMVYTSVFATWFSKNCPHITSASGLILADAKVHAQSIPFDFHIWRHRYWKILAVTNQILKIQIKDSKKIKKILKYIFLLSIIFFYTDIRGSDEIYIFFFFYIFTCLHFFLLDTRYLTCYMHNSVSGIWK